MATKIHDLEPLGYTIGSAYGSTKVELDALNAAKGAGRAAVLLEQASAVTSDTMAAMDRAGDLPATQEDRKQIATKIAEQVLNVLHSQASKRIDHHQRALEIARDMAEVWHFEGHGISGYVACKDDGTGWDKPAQEILDSLADKKLHARRLAAHKSLNS